MRIFRLLTNNPIFCFKLNKLGLSKCYQSAIKLEIWKSKNQCLCGFSGPHIHFLLIPTRSCQKFSKQICLWDLAQSIGILFIIQIVEAIWFFVAMVLPVNWRWFAPYKLIIPYNKTLHQSILVTGHRCSRPKSFWEGWAPLFHRPSDCSISGTPQ